MTNQRACATEGALPVEPVSDWENKQAKGMALMDEKFFRKDMAEIEALRARQAAYLDSLPSDPRDVIRAAERIIHPQGELYPDGFLEALHLAHAIEAMVRHGDLDQDGRPRDAALYLADRMSSAMHRAALEIDRMSDILGNPGRIERERCDFHVAASRAETP